jgi:hypothetical protein
LAVPFGATLPERYNAISVPALVTVYICFNHSEECKRRDSGHLPGNNLTNIMVPTVISDVSRWVALRTPARWEKKLAGILADAAVPVFLPLITRFTTSHGKRRSALVPVFPGYLFCSEADFMGNKRLTPGTRAKVAQVLRSPDPERLRTELRCIADLLSVRQLVQERLVGGVGDVVRVVGGSLAGHEGRVIRVKPNRWVLVVEVSFLGVKLEAEVDERMVEKVV